MSNIDQATITPETVVESPEEVLERLRACEQWTSINYDSYRNIRQLVHDAYEAGWEAAKARFGGPSDLLLPDHETEALERDAVELEQY